MPLGKLYVQEGLLLHHGRRLILQLDGGGFWILSADREAEALLGQRVRVEGIRSGFNFLDVSRIVPC